MDNQWQHNNWNNFGDISSEYGQTWILDATVDNTQDFAECVKIMPASEFGGPDNVYIIEKGVYLCSIR